jgi:hypothetical protein
VTTTDGKIEKIEIITHTSGTFREQDFKQTRTVSIEVADLNQIEVDVPDEAMALFEL